MNKSVFALPFLAFALIAAKPAPPPEKPSFSLTTPAEVAADPANRWTLELSNGGKVVVQLRPDIAPGTVYRIQLLTTQGFYNGLAFHRVIPGFMAQGGDPKGTGEGASPLPDLAAEFNDLPHLRGVTSMARAEAPDSANSQFFIMLAPRFNLDHKYSGFGRVIEGMATVDAIAVGEPPADPTKIVRASIGGPLPAPPAIAAAAVSKAAPAPAAASAVGPEAAANSPAAPVETPAPVAPPATSASVAAPAETTDAAPVEASELTPDQAPAEQSEPAAEPAAQEAPPSQ